jgi:ferrous iron transport protein A
MSVFDSNSSITLHTLNIANRKSSAVVGLVESLKNLSLISPGEIGILAEYTNTLIAQKLLSMGVLLGSKIEVLRSAPWGGGLIIKADNLIIALRKKEAASLLIRQ